MVRQLILAIYGIAYKTNIVAVVCSVHKILHRLQIVHIQRHAVHQTLLNKYQYHVDQWHRQLYSVVMMLHQVH